MRIEHVAVAIGALALAQAQEPPSPTPGTTSAPHSQIVVIAPRDVGIDTSGMVPRLLGGQWQFERGGQLDSGTASNVATQRIPSTGSGTNRPFAFGVPARRQPGRRAPATGRRSIVYAKPYAVLRAPENGRGAGQDR